MRDTTKKGLEDRRAVPRRKGDSERRIPTVAQVDRIIGDRREVDRRGMASAMADALSDILRQESRG